MQAYSQFEAQHQRQAGAYVADLSCGEPVVEAWVYVEADLLCRNEFNAHSYSCQLLPSGL